MEPEIARFISRHFSRTMAVTVACNICRSQVRYEYTNSSPALELHQILNYSSKVIRSSDKVLSFLCLAFLRERYSTISCEVYLGVAIYEIYRTCWTQYCISCHIPTSIDVRDTTTTRRSTILKPNYSQRDYPQHNKGF
jgi:hypothetical protein